MRLRHELNRVRKQFAVRGEHLCVNLTVKTHADILSVYGGRVQPTEPTAVPVVTLHLWGVEGRQVPAAIWRMARDRSRVRRARGVRFAKLLGTGSGETFALRDADLHHWGLLISWDSLANSRIFQHSNVIDAWQQSSVESAHFVMRPISSKGQWARQRPFEPLPEDRTTGGRIAAITRARIRPSKWAHFAAHVPPVAQALASTPGLELRTGIGEAPFGLQGTFSLWRGRRDLETFAYGPQHRVVIEETRRTGWYAEELFAQFAVEHCAGSFRGVRL